MKHTRGDLLKLEHTECSAPVHNNQLASSPPTYRCALSYNLSVQKLHDKLHPITGFGTGQIAALGPCTTFFFPNFHCNLHRHLLKSQAAMKFEVQIAC